VRLYLPQQEELYTSYQIQNFEMQRLSWIMEAGPKFNHKCFLLKGGRGDSATVEGNVQTEAEIGVMGPQVWKAGSHEKLKEAKNSSP
jgi:hypothetical protein